MARNLAEKGNITSGVYGGAISYLEKVGLGYPPLYFNLLAVWTNLSGPSIEGVRSLSLVLSFASLIVFFFLAKLIINRSYLAAFGALLLASDVHFSRASRIGRMDMLCFFLSTLALCFFVFALKKSKNYFYLLAGIFSSLAILTHTMGIISIAVMFLYLLISKIPIKEKVGKILIVIAPSVLIIFLWLFSFGDRLNLFIDSYKIQMFAKSVKPAYGFLLFQTDFFWWFNFILYLVIFMLFIYIFLKNFGRIYLFVFVGFIVSSLLLFMGKEGWYIIYFQPFLTLIELILIRKTWELRKRTLFNITLLTVVFLLLNNLNILVFNNQNSFAKVENSIPGSNNKNYNYHDFAKRIENALPKNEKITVSLVAIPDPYFDLRLNKNIKLYMGIMGYEPSDIVYRRMFDKSDYLVFTWIPYKIA
ncbi:MAG: glycosyltransferase family 39 protein [Actinobacteria bacterium]|nr:glycosyltransferase family 39 protein [Actinomycetota bacterium]